MATATLTDRLVKTRKPPTDKAVEEIRDKNTPGFVLRITKSDKRTFSAVGRVNGFHRSLLVLWGKLKFQPVSEASSPKSA